VAHKILGIDLGAWSVKVAELEAGFRQSKLVGLYERPLADPIEGETPVERAARTLKELMDEEHLQPEMCATTLGGQAILRLLSFPFTDRKKIEQVLGYELESQILGDLEGLVTDFVISSTSADGARVIAVAAHKDLIQSRIDALSKVGAEPRVIGASALSYGALKGMAFSGIEPELIVDFGHEHTHVGVAQGDAMLFARSIPRGGSDVTAALAEAFRMSPRDAQTAKHQQAFVLPPGAVPETPSHRRVDETVREALRPLLRELRQTIAAYRAGGGPQPARLLYTGGAARLNGLAAHLEVELGLPVAPLTLERGEFVAEALATVGIAPEEAFGAALPAQALGLALAAAAPVPQVNLRKGELAYRTDYSFLRGKGAYFAVATLCVLLFAAVNAIAALRSLHKEADALEAQLKRATTDLFGEPRLDGKAVSDELRAGPKGGAPPIPTITAYDVLDEVSRHVPPPDKGKLDIQELEIKPKKTYIKAVAESAQQVDDLVAALEKIDCFEKVEKGKISSVMQAPSGSNEKGDKPTEMKQFTLTINTTCP
jgi:general secretion pathway protein L